MKQWLWKAWVVAVILSLIGCGHSNDRAISSITLDPASSTISVGREQQYRATATFTDGLTANITSDVTWTSSDQSIAAIDSTGKATGVADGVTTIKAAFSGMESSSTLTVSSVKVTPLKTTIGPGESVQFNATETFASDPTKQDITMQVTWTSSNTSIVTIDKDGRATGVGVYDDPIVISAVASDGRKGFGVVRAAQADANGIPFFGNLCVRNDWDLDSFLYHKAVTVDYDLWYLGIKTSKGFCVPQRLEDNSPTCVFTWGGSVGDIRVNLKLNDCSSATYQSLVWTPPGPWMPYDLIYVNVRSDGLDAGKNFDGL